MPKRILLVDDALLLLSALQAGLKYAGYDVTTASSGQSALQQFHKNPPDLLILDITMRGMDGWEVCRQIRQSSAVPIIMLSGYYPSPEEVRQSVEIGANAYLSKPISFEKLLACVQETLNET